MRHHVWVWVVLAGLLGLFGGWAFQAAWRDGGDGALPDQATAETADDPADAVLGEERPAFALPALNEREQSIAAYDGRVILLNFWATWCPPCVEEVPALVQLQDELGPQGLTVVGIALDDAEPVREFARAHGMDYPVLIGSRDAFEIAGRYGNPRGTLPYTVVIDRDGVIRSTHQGALTQAEAAALVEPHL